MRHERDGPQPRDGGTHSYGGYVSRSEYESVAAQKPENTTAVAATVGEGDSSAKNEASEAEDSNNASSEAKDDFNSENAKEDG